MLKWKFALVTTSLLTLAVGLLVPTAFVAVYLSLPVGAALFGLFLIIQVLEKESALYDEQNQVAAACASKTSNLPPFQRQRSSQI